MWERLSEQLWTSSTRTGILTFCSLPLTRYHGRLLQEAHPCETAGGTLLSAF